jgi:hypothetical protein
MSWLVVLALPAAAQAAPPNDDRAAATQLAPLPAQVRGTTVGATAAPKDPRICAPLDASVWYRIDGAPAGDIVLRLKAGGKLDAAVAVFRSVRSELRTVDCARTNDKGAADVSFRASKGDSFLILISQRRDSAPGDFQLVAFLAEPPATAPGDRLAASGAHGTLNALGDRDDAWWFTMQPAQTYRIRVIALHNLCVTASVYASHGRSFGGEVASVGCNGYRLFTPGAGAGGRTASSSTRIRVRLRTACRATASTWHPPRRRTWAQDCPLRTADASPVVCLRSASTFRISTASRSSVAVT